ncbi:hypothetical protein EDC04DRAFT_2609039 [Pisolithus marmoratus]|nr:hypothetical protein EDC04DRAFT_2609039 [Pisolithus marmoratus]
MQLEKPSHLPGNSDDEGEAFFLPWTPSWLQCWLKCCERWSRRRGQCLGKTLLGIARIVDGHPIGGDGWGRGNGHQHLDWRRGGGNYLEGGLGWWLLVIGELDGRRGERGRAREGGAYPPVIANVAGLGGLLLAPGGEVSVGEG